MPAKLAGVEVQGPGTNPADLMVEVKGPLCVDLNGPLILGGLLGELTFQLFRERPAMIGLLLWWIVQGRTVLQEEVMARCKVKPTLLPYNQALIEWLGEQRQCGRPVVLIATSSLSMAEAVARHLGIFDEVVAIDPKADGETTYCEELQKRYGKYFSYISGSMGDLPIWKAGSSAVLIHPSPRTEMAAKRVTTILQTFHQTRSGPKAFFKAIRIHQWVKNLLIFVPLISSHQFGHLSLLLKAIAAFVSFSLCASSIYIINDILDIDTDRQHREKRRRPFASGNLPQWLGAVATPVMLVLAFSLAAAVSVQFTLVLLLYLFLTTLYSFWLKKKLLIDVFTLASLYTLRIVAGSAAYAIPLSSWLLAFSVFFFLSLGFCKRAAEINNLSKDGKKEAVGRAYNLLDLPQINLFGVASGFISSLVLALYMNSDNMRVLYRNQEILWLSCPLMLYWLSRIWLLTSRGLMNEDPIVFAAKDRTTYVVSLLILGLMMSATYFS